MKLKILLIAALLSASLTSCFYSDNDPVNPGDNVYYDVNYITLFANNWSQTQEAGHWYQRHMMTEITPDIVDYGTVTCYILNSNNAWEILPFTTVFRSGDTLTYSEEMWYSYSDNYLDVDYRSSLPFGAVPPRQDIKIKVVIMDVSDNYMYGLHKTD